MSGTYDIEIEQGADFRRVITWTSDGVLVNLTGYTARMQIRKHLNDPAALVELTTENSRITLGGSAGTITLNLTAAVTADLNFINGVYDLELISGGGIVTRLLSGKVRFSKEVTR